QGEDGPERRPRADLPLVGEEARHTRAKQEGDEPDRNDSDLMVMPFDQLLHEDGNVTRDVRREGKEGHHAANIDEARDQGRRGSQEVIVTLSPRRDGRQQGHSSEPPATGVRSASRICSVATRRRPPGSLGSADGCSSSRSPASLAWRAGSTETGEKTRRAMPLTSMPRSKLRTKAPWLSSLTS